MATYAIGDVQGCYDDLMRLLDKISYSRERDILWFAGDLVNRGPKSLQTLQFIRDLGDRAISVLGNHDLHLLAAAYGVRAPHKNDTFGDILSSPVRDELLEWLRHQPLIHHDEQLNFAMVHAGIYPAWSISDAKTYAVEVQHVLRSENYREYFSTMYGNQPDRWSAHLQGSDRLRFIVNSFTRMRFLTESGALDMSEAGPVGSQPNNLTPWFDQSIQLPDDLEIVFGHWAALGGTRISRFHALDSGCVWGNALTALELESGRYISVACDGSHRQ